jgi:hypothetical protein
MRTFTSPFGGDDEDHFDDDDAFVDDHLPDPGPALAAHDVLTGEDHVAVHETARDCFEERGVYDMTFGYNLARLNLDSRHPDAGYRYAAADDGDVLRAEFTPTTPFCPQTDTLARGSFRAWNGEPERHGYDLVSIRVAPMHHRSEAINDALADLEERVRSGDASVTDSGERPETDPGPGAVDASDAPF